MLAKIPYSLTEETECHADSSPLGMIIVGDIKLLSSIVGWRNLINDAKRRDLLWCMDTKNELTRCDPSLIYKGNPVAGWKLDEIDDLRWVYDDYYDRDD